MVMDGEHSFYGVPQLQESLNMPDFRPTQTQLLRPLHHQPQQNMLQSTPMVDHQNSHLYDPSLQRSQTMMVPQTSYFGNVGIDDYFLEESQAELSSIEQNAQSNHDVANPYLAAKNVYLTQKRNQQQSHGFPIHHQHPVQSSYVSDKENEQHVQLVKQQASDPSSYTAQEAPNNHSLPQVQDVQNPQANDATHASQLNSQFISPMQPGFMSQSQTPLNKVQENLPIVDATSTPSRFMIGVEPSQHHLNIPYMQRVQMMSNHQPFQSQLLLSGAMPGCQDFDPMGNLDHGHGQQNHGHIPHGVGNSAISGASVLFRGGNNYTPAGLLGNQHQLADSHRENLNVQAWNLDDHDTQTAHMVDTLIGNSAQTISEEQIRQNSSSQQRSTEGEMDLLHPAYKNQQHHFM